MKYITLFTHIVLTCCLIVSCTSENSVQSSNESRQERSSYDTLDTDTQLDTASESIPSDIRFTAQEIEFTEDLNLETINTYQSRIYVLGWSPDGKLAYIEQSSGIGMAEWDPISVVVQDLLTDDIVHTYRKPEPFKDGITTVDSTLMVYYDEISNLLKSADVNPIVSLQVEQSKEFTAGDMTYSFELHTEQDKGAKLSVKTSDNRKAVLYSENFVEPGFFGLYSVKYYGYIVSPDSSRAAVLLIQETIEIEGAHVYTLKPIGCTFNKI